MLTEILPLSSTFQTHIRPVCGGLGWVTRTFYHPTARVHKFQLQSGRVQSNNDVRDDILPELLSGNALGPCVEQVPKVGLGKRNWNH